jgi:hypothetical protein
VGVAQNILEMLDAKRVIPMAHLPERAMTAPSDRPTPRREFLGRIATSAAVLAGAACTVPTAVANGIDLPGATPVAPRTQWDDSWFGRLTVPHKAVFDAAAVDEGAVLGSAVRYLTGMRDALDVGEGQVRAVLVIRHLAIPMAFNDEIWAKYEIGKLRAIKDGNDAATRNPFLASRRPSSGDRPAPLLAWFASHGHVLLGCAVAAQGLASQVASVRNLDSRVVFDEFKANVVPGMILQPNGVYAVLRAQEAGCAFFKSS